MTLELFTMPLDEATLELSLQDTPDDQREQVAKLLQERQTLSARRMLIDIVQRPRFGQATMSDDELLLSADVVDKLRAASDGDTLDLSNAEYRLVQDKVKLWQFNLADRRYLEFRKRLTED